MLTAPHLAFSLSNCQTVVRDVTKSKPTSSNRDILRFSTADICSTLRRADYLLSENSDPRAHNINTPPRQPGFLPKQQHQTQYVQAPKPDPPTS